MSKSLFFFIFIKVQTPFYKQIQIFCSDNAQEYTYDDFEIILKQYGTLPHLSCPSTFQQNGAGRTEPLWRWHEAC